MLAANIHVSIVLWRVKMAYPMAVSYVQLARAAFQHAPAWQQSAAVTITLVSQSVFIFGVLGIYLLSSAKGMGMAFYDVQGWPTCLPYWTLYACILMSPFVLTAKKMGEYPSLVWVNIGTLVGTVSIPLCTLAWHGVQGYYTVSTQSHVYALDNVSSDGALTGLSMFLFGLSSQLVLVEVISEMKHPEEMPKAYWISAPFQLTIFLVAGLGGYFFIGDKIDHSAMLNELIPFGWPFRVAAVCLMTHMFISYLIKNVVFCEGLWREVLGGREEELGAGAGAGAGVSTGVWIILAGSTLVAAWLIANAVPFFGDAVGLLGASITPLVCLVLPVVMFLRCWCDDRGNSNLQIHTFEWVLMFFEVALAIVLMVFGTLSAVRTIQSDWETFGYPFDCQCKGIWNTCKCSPSHVGMECGNTSVFEL